MTFSEDELRQEDPVAHRCFVRVRSLLAKRGDWRPEYAFGLATMIPICSHYLRQARAFRAVEDPSPELQSELKASLEETRQMARDVLVQFEVLDPELSRFAVVDRDGLDATITALCAPLQS
jgi:hypothetical protein